MTHTLVLNQDAMPLGLLPVSALHWEDAIKAIYLGNVVIVHEYENWEVRSPSQTWRVPSVVMTRIYVKQARAVVFSSENVFIRDRHTCQYCMERFPSRELTKDHVLPAKYGGRTYWENIVAACMPCNQRKGHDKRIVPKVKPRRPTYYEMVDRAREYHLTVPDASWLPYLGWPEDRVSVGKRLSWSPRWDGDVKEAVAA